MRLRETYYEDYGFSREEARDLKKYCCSGICDDFILKQSAIMTNSEIDELLYKSLKQRMSYEDLQMIEYVPIGKQDFYGYQRLCLYNLRNFIKLFGIKTE